MKFRNQIVCGDCVDLCKELPDESIDLVVTSPPYDKLRDYNGYSFDFEVIAIELVRALKPGGVIVWVVGDQVVNGSETGASLRQALYFMSIGLNLHDTMIYLKNSPAAPDTTRYFQVFEYMFVLSKGRPATINLINDRKVLWGKSWGNRTMRQKDGSLKNRGQWQRKNEYGCRFNVWKYNTGKGYTTKDDYAFAHPAMYPEKLAEDHIRSWSNPGDIVLDPFVGSGTTAKMAKMNNRDFIGFDISEEYCELARKRVSGAGIPLFVLEAGQ